MLDIAGIELLPDWPIFLSFVAAGLALNIVPGADMTFVIASAARGGRRDGIIASLGIGAGALVHLMAAVLGLAAILASSAALFNAIKWAGAAYLLWIAFSLVRGGRRAKSEPPAVKTTGWQLFGSAMMVNILNPKVALFFFAFLPQFVNPEAALPSLQILCLGLWFDFVATLVNIAVAVAAAGTAARIRHITWLGNAARWIAASTIAALAIQLAASERRHA